MIAWLFLFHLIPISTQVGLKSLPCVNTNVTGVRAVAGVKSRPNSNRRTVGGKGNANAAPITRRFAVMSGCNAD